MNEADLLKAHGIEHPDGVERLIEALLPPLPPRLVRVRIDDPEFVTKEYCPVKSGCWTKTPGGRICNFHVGKALGRL